MKPKPIRLWWVFAAGALLLFAAALSPRLEVGGLSLPRADPNTQVLLSVMGVLAAVLVVAAVLSVRGLPTAVVVCKLWGVVFSATMVALVFALLGIANLVFIAAMAAFSAAWWWGVSRAITTGTTDA